MTDETSPLPSAPPADDLAVLSEAEALAVWARAAQLHTEAGAALRLAYGAAPAAPSSAVPAVRPPAGMYLVEELRAAAREAGIDSQFVTLALAEHDAVGRESAIAPTDADLARFRRDLGTTDGSVRAVTLVAGSRDAVVDRLRRTFGRAPWYLEFDGHVASDPHDGDVLRFRVPPWLSDEPGDASTRPSVTNPFVYNANRVGVQTVHVLLAPRGTRDARAFEVSLVADLRFGQQLNAAFVRMVPVIATLGGAAFGAIVGEHFAPAVGLTSLAATLGGLAIGVAGAAAVTAGVRRVVRWEYRVAQRVLQQSFDALLGMVNRPIDPSQPSLGATGAPSIAAESDRPDRLRAERSLPLELGALGAH